ncbi:MAG: hypothetical protein Q8N91_03740 [Candidatus Omnitrophota bacterium]|nr:hypothetical protein [Candidatus Omnitrophota bacterium]
MELSLNFGIKYDVELLDKGIVVPIIRLLSVIEFKHRAGWSGPYDAIIDTGSPLSVFPASIQEKCDARLLYKTKISGIVPDKACSLSAKLCLLTFRLSDKYSVTKPIESKAYIADSDKIPLILGFADFLEKFDISIRYAKKSSSLFISE